MQLIQILLPVCDNAGRPFGREPYLKVKRSLSSHFNGFTAYTRAAAQGVWRSGKAVKRDDIIVYEVMTKSFQRRWWRGFQKQLETLFKQDEVVIRAQTIELL